MRDLGLFAAGARLRAGVAVGSARWIGAMALCGAWACASSPPPSSVPVASTVAPRAASEWQVASSYHAPPGCPTQGDYVQYVESRSTRLRLFAEPAAVETSQRVQVRIQPDTEAGGWRGALVIEGDRPLEREVRGERCEDVVLALALVTVLQLERDYEAPDVVPSGAAASAAAAASGTATTGATTPAAALSSAPPAVAAAPAPATAAAAPPVAEPASDAPPAETLPAPAVTSSASASAAAGAVGADVVSGETGATATAEASASAPPAAAANEAELAAEVGVTASTTDRGPTELSEGPPLLVEPALAAYAGYASSPSHAFQAVLRAEARFRPGRQAWGTAASLSYSHSSQKNPAGDLGFDALLAGLSLCPPGLTTKLGIWLEGCAEVRGGVLAVSVSERELPMQGGSKGRPWFELGPSLQAGLPLASRWTLRALSSVTLVLMRDSFDVERVVVDEDGQEQKEVVTLYRPPAVSFQLLLGIGYEL